MAGSHSHWLYLAALSSKLVRSSSQILTYSKAHVFPGYFNAYGVAAHNTSADVFIHLGDYVRISEPRLVLGLCTEW